MRKMSSALVVVLGLSAVALTVTPALAGESTQGTQGIKLDYSVLQEEVDANLNSRLNTRDERPVCQVPEHGLRFDVRGCEKNPQWTLLTW
ncbi:MAG: hypothetical protein ACE5NA_11100 [Nitrospiraceae bacterium]